MSTKDNHRKPKNRQEAFELMESFGIDTGRYDPEQIDPAIWKAMRYIKSSTGLLGDYHDGKVQFAEGVDTIQWYARDRYFSQHSKLLHWIQQQDDLLLAVVGIRPHYKIEDEMQPYAEIHASHRWGYGGDSDE